MAKRGKVLRDPHVGPGLLMLEGRQYPFLVETIWKSDVPPKPGLAVDVELDPSGAIVGITAVTESQIAKEQAELALVTARKKGAALASSLRARFGLAHLVAEGSLLFAWFFLTAISVQLPFLGKIEFTFWQVLGYLNSGTLSQAVERRGSTDAGIYGFLALVAVAGPCLHYFWKDKRAALAGLLPLIFMALIGILSRSRLHSSVAGPTDSAYLDMQNQVQAEIMKAVSLGFGAYVSIVVSLYFAVEAGKQFLQARAVNSPQLNRSEKAAA